MIRSHRNLVGIYLYCFITVIFVLKAEALNVLLTGGSQHVKSLQKSVTMSKLRSVPKSMNAPLKRLITQQFRNTALGYGRNKRNLGWRQNMSDESADECLKSILESTYMSDIETRGKAT